MFGHFIAVVVDLLCRLTSLAHQLRFWSLHLDMALRRLELTSPRETGCNTDYVPTFPFNLRPRSVDHRRGHSMTVVARSFRPNTIGLSPNLRYYDASPISPEPAQLPSFADRRFRYQPTYSVIAELICPGCPASVGDSAPRDSGAVFAAVARLGETDIFRKRAASATTPSRHRG